MYMYGSAYTLSGSCVGQVRLVCVVNVTVVSISIVNVRSTPLPSVTSMLQTSNPSLFTLHVAVFACAGVTHASSNVMTSPQRASM